MRHGIPFLAIVLTTMASAAPTARNHLVAVSALDPSLEFVTLSHEGIPVEYVPKQHITRVVALEYLEKEGHVYGVITAYDAFVPDSLRSWRLTCLTGQLAGSSFLISSNTASAIKITDKDGNLDKISINDMIMVEDVMSRGRPAR